MTQKNFDENSDEYTPATNYKDDQAEEGTDAKGTNDTNESSENDNPYAQDKLEEENREKEPGPLPVWPMQ